MGTQGGRNGSPYLGALKYEVLPPQRSGFWDPEGCSPGRGAGAPAWRGWVAGWVGTSSPGLTVQGAAAQQGPWCLDVEPQGAGGYLPLRAALTQALRTQGEEGYKGLWH